MDQCHSTVGELPGAAAVPRKATPSQVGVTGRAYWRSLEDLADTSDFRDWLEREFPSGASRLLESSRRSFMKLMGASLALAGAATLPGCRRPDHKIMPYSKDMPEEIIPGKSLYFATSVHLPGGAVEGLLVETHEGRPVKIEGNPLHPANNGKTSPWAQAIVLGLYDPDRLKDPVLVPDGGNEADATTPRSWADFVAWSGRHFARLAESGGEGLAFLVDKRRGPTREALRGAILKKFPKAAWVAYDPIGSDEPARATAAAFGGPMREVLHLDRADVILSLDRDFLGDDPDRVRNMAGFAAKRRVLATGDSMSRIYAVESNFSITGAKADHRWALPPSAIGGFLVAVARELGVAGELKTAVDALPVGNAAIDAAAAREVAKDLAAVKGRSLVVVGPTQPASVHALAIAVNAVLGNLDKTVSYRPMGEDEAAPAAALGGLVAAMNAGTVDTLVTIGANPVYDAPGSLDFTAAFARVPNRISASVDANETVAASTWRLPMSHVLESWGDSESWDGTVAPIQPMIAPLYGTMSDSEILLIVAGAESTDGYELVRAVWRARARGDSERAWRRALHDGVLAGTGGTAEAVDADRVGAGVSSLIAELGRPGAVPHMATPESMDVVFAVGMPGDGRFANHGWLQELPDPLTKIVWDNVALMSVATADKYGVRQGRSEDKHRGARMVTVTVDGQRLTVPAWAMPGIPDNTLVIQVGYGRRVCGLVGTGVGVNAFGLSGNGASAGNRRFAAGATVSGEGPGWYEISTTQMHGSMEERSIVREVDLPAWKTYGDKVVEKVDPYHNSERLNFAERLGELAHTPASINAYVNPQRDSKKFVDPAVVDRNELGKVPDFATGPQWGMTVDMTTCTGCSACTIACQAENNIPIVGKIEVNKGREMHWIRIDRYFSGPGSGGTDPDSAMFQPLMCVHCENAPCETVCPVNATVHGPEGINYMVYNRCIGTRYCANNCPYKVRRFNFFQWGTKRFQGGFVGQETLGEVGLDGPRNHNLIPPRLREELNEIERLRQNPDVTVRSRGVMEKCTYCIQRINEARIEAKLQDLKHIPDGMVQTACQQVCPTEAIVFGDIADTQTQYRNADGNPRKGSRVHNMRENARSYMLLGFLNTRPRTTHLAGIRNPNPALASAERKHGWEHPFGHGGGGHGGGDHGDHGDHGHEGHAPEPGGHSLMGHDASRRFEDRGYKMSLAVLGEGGRA